MDPIGLIISTALSALVLWGFRKAHRPEPKIQAPRKQRVQTVKSYTRVYG